jgi:hypothetical protein
MSDREWTPDVNCAARRIALVARYVKVLRLTGKVDIISKGATGDNYRLSLAIPSSRDQMDIDYVHEFNVERNELFVSEPPERARLRTWMDELGMRISGLRLEDYPNDRFRYALLESKAENELPMRVESWDVKREAVRKARVTRRRNKQLARQARFAGSV